jgi:hypothetical protein
MLKRCAPVAADLLRPSISVGLGSKAPNDTALQSTCHKALTSAAVAVRYTLASPCAQYPPQTPNPPHPTPVCAAGSRYLSSDISYFGVGSKNAAFYLGQTVKVVTKTSQSAYVHELCIQGELRGLRSRLCSWVCRQWVCAADAAGLPSGCPAQQMEQLGRPVVVLRSSCS